MSTSSKKTGNKGENIAATYLEREGYKIIQKNYYSKYGEIDIIAENQNIIYFFEVKTRYHSSLNHPLESITYKKSQCLIKTSLHFLNQNNENRSWRIALISILLQRHTSPEIEIIELH
ncbi:YraN family protein [Candidatus Peregrinibacteria bacterium]|jgi:putative endonuclease|nr:YraN family protein [Candidatus Peregrinibacteria bacterium]MBT4147671.1 YraN family protein [Candidatus Peregrinibacteria bacterium]MBT4366092.1 YraN family protein [Candidatus Peregrinibacteria bacterium]MBT4455799.1 YraN family protein [Candidatus Peregrinibacteria bacterium]